LKDVLLEFGNRVGLENSRDLGENSIMAMLVPVIHEMSSLECRAAFDRAANVLLRMSGEEFLKKWNNGEFGANPDDTPGVMEVAALIPAY
jgi:hypothetical protein